MTAATDTSSELGVIVPEERILQIPLEDGEVAPARVKRLKTLEILQVLRILTASFGMGAMQQLRMQNQTEDADEFAAQLVSLLLLAIPQASFEFVTLLINLVEPVDPKQTQAVQEVMQNPETDTSLEVIETAMFQEAESLKELMGKVKALWGRVAPLYMSKKKGKRQGSPARSTS